MTSRILNIVALAGAAVVGSLVLAPACIDCPEPDPVEPGTYLIVNAERNDLVGNLVEVSPKQIIITYTTSDGSKWLVTYDVTETVP